MSQRSSDILLVMATAFVTAFIVGLLAFNYGKFYGMESIKERVRAKAEVCHTLRNMGLGAWAMTVGEPELRCKDLYDIIGETEPPLKPEAAALEATARQKNQARAGS